MSESANIGHVMVPCPRCGQMRRIAVAGSMHTVQVPGSFPLRMRLGEDSMGTSYLKIMALPGDDHSCPRPRRQTTRRSA